MRCPPGGTNPFLQDGETLAIKPKSNSPDAAEESNKKKKEPKTMFDLKEQNKEKMLD